ncbi:hypothetical protein ACPOL_4147 [Acidisarcina polymorpha]|uniref:Acetyltransferase n=1 Tax=Acidisarcina polymorpha TaxID=2211140 RepID=A0A2Z5G3P6_9BACT|nr:hypothetical protein ACPOL_4147 [Acidisarcina polymorpha]
MILPVAGADPTLRPSFSFRNRLARGAWGLCWVLFFRTSPRPFHAWRSLLLRLFGATLGTACHFYPKSKIWAPWNLTCEDRVSVGDDAELYNPSHFYLASHCIISQGAYLCGASHDYNDREFAMISFPMKIGAYAWICARAIVHPRVNVGTGAILGLGSIATSDLEPFGIYVGLPARKVKERLRASVPEQYRHH